MRHKIKLRAKPTQGCAFDSPTSVVFLRGEAITQVKEAALKMKTHKNASLSSVINPHCLYLPIKSTAEDLSVLKVPLLMICSTVVPL